MPVIKIRVDGTVISHRLWSYHVKRLGMLIFFLEISEALVARLINRRQLDCLTSLCISIIQTPSMLLNWIIFTAYVQLGFRSIVSIHNLDCVEVAVCILVRTFMITIRVSIHVNISTLVGRLNALWILKSGIILLASTNFIFVISRLNIKVGRIVWTLETCISISEGPVL